MPDSLLTIVVEASSAGDQFVWVIMEGRDHDQMVEVASSLGHYDTPSEAYRAGEVVLRGLGLESLRRSDDAQGDSPGAISQGAAGGLRDPQKATR